MSDMPKIEKTDAEWRAELTQDPVPDHAVSRHRAGGDQPTQRREAARNVYVRGLRL